MAQPYWGARGLKFGWVEVQYMSRLSTKNYKPRATGSLRHLMLKVFCAVLLTAPYRLNYSKLIERIVGKKWSKWYLWTKVYVYVIYSKNFHVTPSRLSLCDTLTGDWRHIKRRRLYHKLWGPKVSWGKEANWQAWVRSPKSETLSPESEV